MSKRAGACFVVMALVLLFMACARIDAGKSSEEGGIAFEKLAEMNSVPLNWGKLASVSALPESGLFQLWFQDENGNIRMATYQIEANRLWSNARLIPQK
jgi:hypothetical protein